MWGADVRWLGVTLLAFACDTSSDGAGTVDGGNAESAAGKAGSPAGGSAGRAGAGGGLADTGGTSDAAGGTSTGGTSTGGTSNDSGTDSSPCIAPDEPHTIPTAYCETVAALPCGVGLDVPGCVDLIDEGVARAETRGCKCQLLAELACAIEHGLICPQDFDDVRVNPACAALEDAEQRCMGRGDNCSHSSIVGGQSCKVACDQYAADCSQTGPGAAWTCTCTYGPNLGKTFTPASCDDASVAAACR